MNYSQIFYIIFCFILFIIQVILLIKTKEWQKSITWNILIGISISKLISVYISRIIFALSESVDIGLSILLYFWVILSTIVNILFIVISIKIKNKSENQIKFNKYSIISGIILLIISIILVFLIPKMDVNSKNEQIKEKVINYLNQKYGDKNYEVLLFKNDYSYNGFIQGSHIGYDLSVSYPEENIVFEVNVDGTDPKESIKINEGISSIVDEYYIKKINDFLSEKYKIKFDYLGILYTNKIPDNYGRIPTFDELLELEVVDFPYELKIHDKSDLNKNERIERAKNISLDLIKILNITKNITVNYHYIDESNEHVNYLVENKGNILQITNKDNKDELYEFDITNY